VVTSLALMERRCLIGSVLSSAGAEVSRGAMMRSIVEEVSKKEVLASGGEEAGLEHT
jgi:hypothetical protein